MPMIEILNCLKAPEAEVVKNIISAFPPTSPPKNEDIVGPETEHLRKCDECRSARRFLEGKTREIILRDERNYPHLVNAFDFLTPEAWHYYLPVFLVQDLIRQRHGFRHFWHYNEPGLIESFWVPRIELIDGPQCEALLEYLQFWRPTAKMSGQLDELNTIFGWWQGIYQDKVGVALDVRRSASL